MSNTTEQMAKDLILEHLPNWPHMAMSDSTREAIEGTVVAAIRKGELAGIDRSVRALNQYQKEGR